MGWASSTIFVHPIRLGQGSSGQMMTARRRRLERMDGPYLAGQVWPIPQPGRCMASTVGGHWL